MRAYQRFDPSSLTPAEIAEVAEIEPQEPQTSAGSATSAGGDLAEPKTRDALPEEWTAAFARLRQTERPAHVPENRWCQVLEDAKQLMWWVPMLEALGWTPEDVYGRYDLDRQSLVWKVQGQLIGPITSIAVTLRGTDGSTTWVYRRVEI